MSNTAAEPPTTKLGDWHANLLLMRPQLIHCMNDRSTLSVLLPAKDGASFPVRLRTGLANLLTRLGVPRPIIDAEVGAMETFALGASNSRSVLGCMRDASNALAYAIASGRYRSLEEMELDLTHHIHGPTGYKRPGELAVDLLMGAANERNFERRAL